MRRFLQTPAWPIWLLILTLTFVQGVIWLNTIPPWGAPDEPGHFLYVQLFAELGRAPRPEDVTPERWRDVIASMEAHRWSAYVHPQGSETPPTQDPIFLASGAQIGQKPPGYYALAAGWLRLLSHWREQPLARQLRWLRWLSLLLHTLTTAMALGLTRRLWPDARHRALGMGLLTGLLPMVGFIGVSVNNDALTMLWGAAGFAGLILARTRLGWSLMLAWTVLGTVGIDAGLAFLWPLALARWLFFAPAPHGLRLRPRAELRASWRVGVILALILIPSFLLIPNPHWAAGWRRIETGRSRADGQLFLQAEGAPARISQTLSGLLIVQRQGQPLTVTVQAAGSGGTLIMRLVEEGGESEALCPLSAQIPTTCQLTHGLSVRAHHIGLHLILPAGKARIRVVLTDPAGWSLLLNGDGAIPAPLGDPLFTWLEKRLPLPAGYFSRALYGHAWDVPSLIRYAAYGAFAWASFWGWFGWLTRPFPWWVYVALAVATLAALVGLWRKVFSGRRAAGEAEWLAAGAVWLISVQVFAPMLGQAWQPQGRYFFPALLPMAILLILGWEALIPSSRRDWLPAGILLALTALNLLAL